MVCNLYKFLKGALIKILKIENNEVYRSFDDCNAS